MWSASPTLLRGVDTVAKRSESDKENEVPIQGEHALCPAHACMCRQRRHNSVTACHTQFDNAARPLVEDAAAEDAADERDGR